MRFVCGIAGVAGRAVGRMLGATVEAMSAAQRHRGPDGSTVTGCVDAVLAMNTLRVVTSAVPLGPYRDGRTGLLLTFNGEVYNWRELARAWGISLAPGDSDAHLVLRAWAEHGAGVLAHLDGMFALAVYDPRAATLTLARDRLGEKPLYWRVDGDRLAFASEVDALLQYAGAPLTGRPEMLAVEGPLGCDTPFVGVQLLPAGHSLTFDVVSASARRACYWSLQESTPYETYGSAQRDYSRAVDDLSDLLAEYIPTRAPTGDHALLLSGGLDSALLAYLMRPPVCITVRYPGRDRLDESAAAARVAAEIGAELVIVEPTVEQFRDAVPDLVRALGYPMGNASTFSEHAAYAAAADRGIRVVVAGAGPDELLLGYARHALAVFGPDACFAGGLNAYRPLAHALTGGAKIDSAREAYLRLVLRGPDLDGAASDVITERLGASNDLGRALTLTDLATSWRALMLTSDALSSRFGLERRSPYLARALVEFSYAMPLSHKLPAAGHGKALLRAAARRHGVPADLCAPGDKLGFASPVPGWLRTDLEPWCLQLLEQARDLAPPGILRAVMDRGRQPTGTYDRHRTQALMTAVWLLQHHAPNQLSVTDPLRWAHAS